MRYLIVLLTFSVLSACQSNAKRQFEKLSPGMEKVEVLELMETPWTTTRLHGKDRWIYVFYEDGVRFEKEVHFLNGKAVYIGDTWKPADDQTAESKDKKNADNEVKIEEEEKKHKEELKNAYTDYEKDVKGEGQKIKYMPDFVEVQ
jgi:outer membrane protein assembly factor BamE